LPGSPPPAGRGARLAHRRADHHRDRLVPGRRRRRAVGRPDRQAARGSSPGGPAPAHRPGARGDGPDAGERHASPCHPRGGARRAARRPPDAGGDDRNGAADRSERASPRRDLREREPMADDMEAFAAEVREFLEANAQRRTTADTEIEWGVGEDRITYFGDDPPDVDARKVAAAKDWQRRRYEAGLGWITGPARYGGRELTHLHDMVYDALEAEYDVPDTGALSLIGLGMIGPTILLHGQEAIKDSYLPAMYRGEINACQLFSEPAAGSDLASLETTAVRDGEGWRLNGQK